MTSHALKMSVLTTLLTLTSLGAYAASDDRPFVLEGFERSGTVRLSTAGYDYVIAREARRVAVDGTMDIETSTNLCIAYIKTTQLDTARGACDAAIAAALAGEPPSSTRWPRSLIERKRDLARAYSNRSVLNWFSGARADAEADLAKAASYAPRARFVLRNAAALKMRGSSDQAIAALAGR